MSRNSNAARPTAPSLSCALSPALRLSQGLSSAPRRHLSRTAGFFRVVGRGRDNVIHACYSNNGTFHGEGDPHRTDFPGGMVFAQSLEAISLKAIRASDKAGRSSALAVCFPVALPTTRRTGWPKLPARSGASSFGSNTPTVFGFRKRPMPELTEPILLALSHKPSANLLEDRLSRKGATVIRVHDGQEASRRIQKSTLGVVVAETGLPGRTGLELLRSVPPLRPPFVLLGRRDNDENMIRAFEMNAFDYFTRPFAPRIAAGRILRVPRLLSAAAEARAPVPK